MDRLQVGEIEVARNRVLDEVRQTGLDYSAFRSLPLLRINIAMDVHQHMTAGVAVRVGHFLQLPLPLETVPSLQFGKPFGDDLISRCFPGEDSTRSLHVLGGGFLARHPLGSGDGDQIPLDLLRRAVLRDGHGDSLTWTGLRHATTPL